MLTNEYKEKIQKAYKLVDEQNFAEALLLCDEGISSQPNESEAYKLKGAILSHHGNYFEAIPYFKQALTITPTIEGVNYNLSVCLASLKFYDQAKSFCQKELSLNPQHQGALELLPQIEAQRVLPDYLSPTYQIPETDIVLKRYRPREFQNYTFIIEIMGTCNLRCPSCPVGNMTPHGRPKGHMDINLFHQILDKALKESPVPKPRIYLFNWGEPILNPHLPEMITRLNQEGLDHLLSTNLNLRKPKQLEALIKANPQVIKISISGFAEDTYAKTHTGGDLELLKENMLRLRELIDTHKANTHVWVGQHVYKHNQDDVATLAGFCDELGFEHGPITAFFQPLEKLIEYYEGKSNPADQALIDNLLMDPLLHVKEMQEVQDPLSDCEYRFATTCIDFDGSLPLCCAIYDRSHYLPGNFLDTPLNEIIDSKYQQDICKSCYKYAQNPSNRIYPDLE